MTIDRDAHKSADDFSVKFSTVVMIVMGIFTLGNLFIFGWATRISSTVDDHSKSIAIIGTNQEMVLKMLPKLNEELQKIQCALNNITLQAAVNEENAVERRKK